MSELQSRREFLGQSALALTGAAGLWGLGQGAQPAAAAALAPAPILAKAPWVARDFAKERPSLLAWPSERAVKEHLKLYAGYVAKAKALDEALAQASRDPAKANATFSELRELKLELSFAIGGVKNHELFFGHLGGPGGRPTGALAQAFEQGYGSFDAFVADLKATGLAARGWAWVAYDLERKTLATYLGDAQNTFPVWSAVPILALDVYEHAYFIDYGTSRAAYIDAFFQHLDWAVVARHLQQAQLAATAMGQA